MEASMDEAAKLQLQGQAHVWKHIFSYVNSMALKCSVELQIPDILHSHNRPLSLSEISSRITNSSSPNVLPYLSRIMRLLVHSQIFTSTISSGSVLYGPTPASSWLVTGSTELSLGPFVLMNLHPRSISPRHRLSGCVREGGTIPFENEHGFNVWDFAATNPEFNKVFNDGIVVHWENNNACNPLCAQKGINFDLPHVIATAPEHVGVSHVGGVFKEVPTAKAVFMKWVLHIWDDEDCVKILKNCRKAISEKIGKVIIVEVVLNPEGDEVWGSSGMELDLVMMTGTFRKERTESEWKALVEKGGFPRYKITKIPALYSIIEAYPR
ncbi:OLC1v1022620C1 [Oldenlandia corymbosa var. corymbosa]|uniref:OLC1v1022620C1 n=1 Tax=Oldenlandia corymbosa var. corymbosa TaxID=529605 RepID=A0AAV1C0L7_OLDCO|nr:OLC1v1022620C1 [Oldenlandia corymbosa var. corymbosa]